MRKLISLLLGLSLCFVLPASGQLAGHIGIERKAGLVEPAFPSVTGIKTHFKANGQGFVADTAIGSTWTDLVSAYNFSQATGSLQPIYRAAPTGFNSWPALQFDGVDDKLANATNAFNDVGTAAGTIYAVVRVNTNHADTGNPWTNDTGYAGAVRYGLHFYTNVLQAFGYDGANKIATTAITTGTTYIARVRWDSTNLGVRINNAAETTTACGALTTGNTDFTTGKYSTNTLDGWISEIVTLNASVSAGDDTNLLTYFNTKYMIY